MNSTHQDTLLIGKLYELRDNLSLISPSPSAPSLGDAAIIAIAKSKPYDIDGLKSISGVSEDFVDKFGQLILRTLRLHASDDNALRQCYDQHNTRRFSFLGENDEPRYRAFPA